MKTTCHSEYLPIQKLYVKPVQYGFQSQEIINNQWRELNYLSAPTFDNAQIEYLDFLSFFEQNNINLEFFTDVEKVNMDAIYCRDASIATDFGVIICNMGKGGRMIEPIEQKKVYQKNNISILGEISHPGTVEGGDVAWIDKKTLAIGHTYRTNQEGIRQIKELLEPKGVEVVVVDLPHYKGKSDVFHLMSILSPVDKNLAVVYSPLMPIGFRNYLLERGFDLVEVPEEEFETMGCNVLAIAPRKCLMVDGNPKTKALLESQGCEVITYNGQEISVKGGGGPTCLTRPLERICV